MANEKQNKQAAEVRNAKAKAKEARAETLRAKAELAREQAAKLAGTPLGGFVNFIREKGVVGLAIGLAIGTAATGLVTQIVNAVITPTISLLLSLIGLESLRGLNFVAKRAADGTPLVTYAIGDLIDALIKFIAIAAVIYFVVIGLKLDKLDKKKE
jgi:large conductance mechanosensitive channel protein